MIGNLLGYLSSQFWILFEVKELRPQLRRLTNLLYGPKTPEGVKNLSKIHEELATIYWRLAQSGPQKDRTHYSEMHARHRDQLQKCKEVLKRFETHEPRLP